MSANLINWHAKIDGALAAQKTKKGGGYVKTMSIVPPVGLTVEQIDYVLQRVRDEQISKSAVIRQAVVAFLKTDPETQRSYVDREYDTQRGYANFYLLPDQLTELNRLAETLEVTRKHTISAAMQYALDNRNGESI